ncbi:GNAT family N-acetyltransferase [Geodermatophilus sabuli]|uniref:Acetyltransferase (GNAT) family protein n=1 Tax=Geodermatophilus sabuli TaxID=1564158 RepID=A0A285EJ38_9ACTN|nr:GNAT family N-acetyltransferase [Geodermatophilus sabuli]MBB3083024.1 ribosomal protein S18 acetylase RimI-like enzyme [Geodermatophilus sabuli]SNX98021.1 Acetyltransferase (GNAT) family protein [Geodermatophilus sabuli]
MGQSRSPLDVVGLERVAARGWRGSEEAALGEWLLRAGGGFTGRANSVLVAGDPGRALPNAVDAVTAWYRERGLRPCAQLPGRQARPADAAFAAAGWERDEDVLVLTAPLTSGPDGGVPVDLSPTPDDAWLAGYHHRGRPLPPTARAVLTNAEDVVFASVRLDEGPLAAVARGVVTDDWLGVAAVTVAEEHRRRGLATAVMAALQRWGAERGATWVYLQVTSSNAPARALYRSAGFIEHHRYHYRYASD